ncbi:hypothetical protein RCL_jg20927.t2 [Rhizophagus clarus]|uniref:Uncharacterized protein n=1 Tax=Rhizophagus clarus TaxID=94130 RepID=A0A8H3LEH1_9GLOM|nr:hypothetical protein RCL_jg20927.t2 [Rhizophagus clarus]
MFLLWPEIVIFVCKKSKENLHFSNISLLVTSPINIKKKSGAVIRDTTLNNTYKHGTIIQLYLYQQTRKY